VSRGSQGGRRRLATFACALALGITGCASSTATPASRPAPVTQDLLAASYRKDVPAARALLASGADSNAKDSSEQNAFLIATSEVGDDPRLLDLTLASGADVQAKDRFNGTGLIRAADRGYVTIVDRLLRTDVDIDHVNRLGWTALLETILLGHGDARHVEIARLLIQAGVDVNLPDGEGVTPLAHAERLGQEPIAAMLRAAGAQPSQVDRTMQHPGGRQPQQQQVSVRSSS
jgi:ankyrin repeat protein